MKKVLMLLLVILSLRSVAQEIAGKVVDEKLEPLISATILVYQGGVLKAGNVTDYEGNYLVKPLVPGYYDVLVTYTGYDSMMVTKLVVQSGGRTTRNFTMSRKANCLKQAVVVRAYRTPLINENAGRSVRTAEEIRVLPNTQLTDVAALGPSMYQTQRGKGVNVGGARANGTLYIIDGVQVQNIQGQYMNPSEESYKKEAENDFMNVKVSPLSTMSVDVDRASYSNVRRNINDGQKPPVDAVRVEEMINYFDYSYPQPEGDDPVAIQTELTSCPWQRKHKLLHIGLQARRVNTDKLPPSNLVFLVDVSGSMDEPDKLPLLVAGMKLLVANLRAIDKVAIVTYAGNAGLVLEPTAGDKKQEIMAALDRLKAGGSTAGGAGIKLAYEIAAAQFLKRGNNRVILATDGDFNVGVSNDNELEALIVKERESGVYLTCLGFGTGNYKDSRMEMLADKGNGNYAYIDNIQEAQKTLVSEFGGTLFTVAKDVKAQIEFNPAKVAGYRLVGYENRMLKTEDFKDDKKDAGDMGSGHSVTIIYEIIPAGVRSDFMRQADDLKYQQPEPTNATGSGELATIKFRYKKPDGNKSKEMIQPIADKTIAWDDASEDTRFSESVAMFGMLLKDSKYKGSSSYDDVLNMAADSMGASKDGYRTEFVGLVKAAKQFDAKLSAK